MKFAQDLVNCAPSTTGDRRYAGGRGLSVSTRLLDHPVFGAVGGFAVPDSRLFK